MRECAGQHAEFAAAVWSDPPRGPHTMRLGFKPCRYGPASALRGHSRCVRGSCRRPRDRSARFGITKPKPYTRGRMVGSTGTGLVSTPASVGWRGRFEVAPDSQEVFDRLGFLVLQTAFRADRRRARRPPGLLGELEIRQRCAIVFVVTLDRHRQVNPLGRPPVSKRSPSPLAMSRDRLPGQSVGERRDAVHGVQDGFGHEAPPVWEGAARWAIRVRRTAGEPALSRRRAEAGPSVSKRQSSITSRSPMAPAAYEPAGNPGMTCAAVRAGIRAGDIRSEAVFRLTAQVCADKGA